EVAGVVREMVLRGCLSLLVQVGRPVVERHGTADEVARGNHRVGMERGEEQLAVEPVHAAAEADQAVEDLLPVDQSFEPGGKIGIAHGWIGDQIGAPRSARSEGGTVPSTSVTSYSRASSAAIQVPPERFMMSGSRASAAITRPGNSIEEPMFGFVTVCAVI